MQVVQSGSGYYIHDVDAIRKSRAILDALGKRALVVTGHRSFAATGSRLVEVLSANQMSFQVCHYGGECTDEEAERIVELVGTNWDMVIAVGGGKVIDLGKLIAQVIQCPYVTVPTVVSNCSATVPVAVVYTPDGNYKASRILLRPPSVTIVDDGVLRVAPLRYFLSGIGDTLAKRYESRITAKKRSLLVAEAGQTMAELIGEYVTEHVEEAIANLNQSAPGDAFVNVVDAVILLAGMVGGIGGPACRAAAAHALHNALTFVPSMSQSTHGEKVAYGILVQMALTDQPRDSMRDLQRFFRTVGLPGNWQDLAHEELPTMDALEKVAQRSVEVGSPMHRMEPVPTVEDICQAMRQIESL